MDTNIELLAVKQNDIILYVNNLSSELLNKFKKSEDSFLYAEDNSDKTIYIDTSVHNLKTIYINEWVPYKVESLDNNITFNKKDFLKKGTYGNENFGTLIFKNCMGLSFFKNLELFIVSKKIDEQTFKQMLNIVNDYILSLSFDFNKSTFTNVNWDSKSRTDIGYHTFILIMSWLDSKQKNTNLFTIFNFIKSNPHRNDYNNNYYADINEISYIDEDVIVDLFSNLDQLIEVQGVNNYLANKLSKNSKKYLPNKILQTEIQDTFDTNENRFIKYFLNYIITIISSFADKFIDDKETMINYDIIQESLVYKNKLQLLVNTTFLRTVGNLSYIPSYSTVLQNKEGYRQFYNYYLTIKSMPIINNINEDLSDIIENKNLDLLYEYYCFFMISEIICDLYNVTINNLSFNINHSNTSKSLTKKTNGNYFDFKYVNINLPRIKLFYNKRYKTPLSYSEPYDPDISIEVYDEFDEIEKIIIFDAKFRVKKSRPNSDNPKFKFNIDDITKMHAYKDAIKNVLGSFVLYPGDFLKIYSNSNTNKFNGVGAFPLNPNKTCDLEKLKRALSYMLKSDKKFNTQ